MHLQLSDENFELGLFQGAAYSTYLANMRQSEEPGYIQSFYKCKLCSFCTIYGVDKEYKEFAFDLLSRQFSCMNITDRFYFLTGSIPSYILSIYSLIFCEILKLILFPIAHILFYLKMKFAKVCFGATQYLTKISSFAIH